MSGLLYQLGISLRLYFRNRMGLLYGYLFPTIFLVAFWVLYRYEQVPLARHMGELLTVTVLGGACFGLPTTLVGERERGVWRRYRLAPIPTGSLVASTIAARYFILITAGVLQLALALAIGMPMPRHPLELWLAFTFVSFAFLGLGLVIATLADNVPAVQALGQSIFLPMLIIGGVAVRLESLPGWAQHASAFFPGRYAVETLQACVTGAGLRSASFSLLALLVIGAAASFAGAKMFRWDTQQRFAGGRNRGWLVVALAAWLAVGLLAEWRKLITVTRPIALQSERATSALPPYPPLPERPDTPVPLQGEAAPVAVAASDSVPVAPAPPARADTALPVQTVPAEGERDALPPGPWRAVTAASTNELNYHDLPPDDGVVTPFAAASEQPHRSLAKEIACVRRTLPDWKAGNVEDPVQRVRNYLYVAAIPDMFQMEELEPWMPRLVLERVRQDIPREQLIKILYWIATHPSGGDTSAAGQLKAVCIDTGGRPTDVKLLRERSAIYATKMLGRLTGRIPPG